MLGKLIKNEFKTSWQSMSGIYLAAGITVLAMLLLLFVKSAVVSVLGGFALMGISLVAIVMTIVMVISNYNTSMFGTQGYLTHTLPVKSSDLLFSKTIVSFAWIFITSIFVAAASVFSFFYSLAQISENTKAFMEQIYQLLSELKAIPDIETLKVPMVAILIMFFIFLLALVCKIYFAITIANTKLFRKMPSGLAAIIVLFAVMAVSVALFVLGTKYIPMATVIVENSVYFTITKGQLESVFALSPTHPYLPVGGIIFPILTSIGLQFATSYLIRKKINIR